MQATEVSSRIVQGPATFLCDDVIDGLDQLFSEGVQPHLAITSPPYNLGKDYGSANDAKTYTDYLDWTERWLAVLHKLQPIGGRLCLNLPVDITQKDRGFSKVLPLAYDVQGILEDVGYRYQTTIDWCEGNIGRRTAWGSYGRPSAPFVTNPNERILVMFKGSDSDWGRASAGKTWDLEPEQFKAWTLGAWEFPGATRKSAGGHPAPFPEELPRRLMLMFSFLEDTILDPFVGSGTTARVAARTGRTVYGIDNHRPYLEYAATSIRDDMAIKAGKVTYLPVMMPMPVGSDAAEVVSRLVS